MQFGRGLVRIGKNNWRRVRFCCLAAAGLQPCLAVAVSSADDTFKPFVSSSLLYDSNFLRFSNNLNPQLVTGKSSTAEFMKQMRAGFDMNWQISNQQIVVNASANQNWFQNYSNYDYTGWDTKAQWNWSRGSNLDGQIGYTDKEALGSFSQLNGLNGQNGLIANLTNIDKYFANGGYLFHPNGKIILGGYRTNYHFDSNTRATGNFIEYGAQVDLQYLSPLGSTWGIQVRAADGSYPDRPLTATSTLDNAYNRFVYVVTGDWNSASKKLHINGDAGFSQQKYKHFAFRDYSALVGNLNIDWLVTLDTTLNLVFKRQISQSNNLTSSFILLTSVELNPKWQVSPKVAMSLPLYYYQQQFSGNSGINNAINGATQVNDTDGVGLNFTYQPLEYINMNALFKYEKRDSNAAFRGYETQSVQFDIQATF